MFLSISILLNVKMSNMFTVSDEAFLLLVLENYHNCWIDLAQQIRNNLLLIPSWDSISKLRGTHTLADSEPNLQFSGDQLTQLLKHSSLIH